MSNLETGSVDNIRKMIQDHDYVVDEKKALIFGEAPAYEKNMELFHKEVEEKDLFGKEKTQLLLDYQMDAYRKGYKPLTISTNLYGYTVGSHFVRNIRGGRFSMTSRGISLERAFEVGLQMVRDGSNTTLRVSLSKIPDEIAEELGLRDED